MPRHKNISYFFIAQKPLLFNIKGKLIEYRHISCLLRYFMVLGPLSNPNGRVSDHSGRAPYQSGTIRNQFSRLMRVTSGSGAKNILKKDCSEGGNVMQRKKKNLHQILKSVGKAESTINFYSRSCNNFFKNTTSEVSNVLRKLCYLYYVWCGKENFS